MLDMRVVTQTVAQELEAVDLTGSQAGRAQIGDGYRVQAGRRLLGSFDHHSVDLSHIQASNGQPG
jgi:hypothetical protein